MKWILGGRDVTKTSRGITHVNGQTTSQLQVNFIGISDLLSNYKCEEEENSQLRCKIVATCQAVRGNVEGVKKDHVIEVVVPPKLTKSAAKSIAATCALVVVSLATGLLGMFFNVV